MKNWAITSVIKAETAAQAAMLVAEADVVSIKKINIVPTAQGQQMTDCIGFSGSVEEEDFNEIEEDEELEDLWGFQQ